MNWNSSHSAACVRLSAICSDLRLRDARFLILSAHPDDETLGASAILMRGRATMLVYLTDGAPRDRNLRSPDLRGSRSEYARARFAEMNSALEIAGVDRGHVICLGAIDQESAFEIGPRARFLTRILQLVKPDFIITHPYEGGHPDHDAAALIANLAIRGLRLSESRMPDLLEMTSYHACDGRLETGRFLQNHSDGAITIQLSVKEASCKRAMMKAYRSQWRVLQSFEIGSELIRPAPAYDFTRPPHSGKLWYECLGWSMTGDRWRCLARQAIDEAGGK